ncbi:hypothetical protein, partial [Haloferax sp. Atlit-10N]|uniref:hypothetical protein n=1 Tax=Haloferax sp. Atlit-10N TaxID=2077204 RepID=UPI001F3892E3
MFIGTLDQKVDLETAMIALGLENENTNRSNSMGSFIALSFKVTLLVFVSSKVIIARTTDRDLS